MILRFRRLALMLVAVVLIAVALVACQAPTGPTPVLTTNNTGASVFHTPNTSLNTPTPTFPPFTIGAWPSNYSPANVDTITIYVMCRIQDPSMNNPPAPAAGQKVTIFIGDPVGQQNTVTAGPDGIAAWTLNINDQMSGQPVRVTVNTTFNGQAYTAGTFFTPAPTTPPTPTPGPTATPGGNGGATPTPTTKP